MYINVRKSPLDAEHFRVAVSAQRGERGERRGTVGQFGGAAAAAAAARDSSMSLTKSDYGHGHSALERIASVSDRSLRTADVARHPFVTTKSPMRSCNEVGDPESRDDWWNVCSPRNRAGAPDPIKTLDSFVWRSQSGSSRLRPSSGVFGCSTRDVRVESPSSGRRFLGGRSTSSSKQ